MLLRMSVVQEIMFGCFHTELFPCIPEVPAAVGGVFLLPVQAAERHAYLHPFPSAHPLRTAMRCMVATGDVMTFHTFPPPPVLPA